MTRKHLRKEGDPSLALARRIRIHQHAFSRYDEFVPLADPLDGRFSPDALVDLDYWQNREARRWRALLAHPVRSLIDMRAKSRYLLRHPGSGFLLGGSGEDSPRAQWSRDAEQGV